jgi:prepilin-type N-terminal cleavage/methylation domain-containing protein
MARSHNLTGFTLAELLIALAIIGVITTFTIPKVLQSQADQQKKTVLRETISALSEILTSATRQGDYESPKSGNYFLGKLNALKICNTDASAQGCWNNAVQGANGESAERGVILHNGATIAGFNDTGGSYNNGVMIDWNGVKPPNTVGDDQLLVILCFDQSGCSNIRGNGPKGPGAVGPFDSNDNTHLTPYLDAFQ